MNHSNGCGLIATPVAMHAKQLRLLTVFLILLDDTNCFAESYLVSELYNSQQLIISTVICGWEANFLNLPILEVGFMN